MLRTIATPYFSPGLSSYNLVEAVRPVIQALTVRAINLSVQQMSQMAKETRSFPWRTATDREANLYEIHRFEEGLNEIKQRAVDEARSSSTVFEISPSEDPQGRGGFGYKPGLAHRQLEAVGSGRMRLFDSQ